MVAVLPNRRRIAPRLLHHGARHLSRSDGYRMLRKGVGIDLGLRGWPPGWRRSTWTSHRRTRISPSATTAGSSLVVTVRRRSATWREAPTYTLAPTTWRPTSTPTSTRTRSRAGPVATRTIAT